MILRICLLLGFFAMGLLSSCAIGPANGDDGVLKPYVDEFATLIGTDRRRVTVKSSFRTTSTESGKFSTVGVCHPVFNRITIDPDYWYRSGLTEIQKKSLMFHELAHCHCWKNHDDKIMPDMCPVSLMHSKTIPLWCLEQHWEHYKNELKKKCDE